MTANKLIPKSLLTKTAPPRVDVKVQIAPPKPKVPTDPGPMPAQADGKTYWEWCMRQRNWKAHLAATTKSQGQLHRDWCIQRADEKRIDPKGIRKAVIAILKHVVENFAYEGGIDALTHHVTNDLDAFLQEDAIAAILRGEG